MPSLGAAGAAPESWAVQAEHGTAGTEAGGIPRTGAGVHCAGGDWAWTIALGTAGCWCPARLGWIWQPADGAERLTCPSVLCSAQL